MTAISQRSPLHHALVAAVVLVPWALSCSDSAETSAARMAAQMQAVAPVDSAFGARAQEAVVEGTPGLFARGPGQKRFGFYPWESEATINDLLETMMGQEGSAEIHFAPGRYVIDQWIFVSEVANLTISGSPRVELVFRDGPDTTTTVKRALRKGEWTISVEHPDRLRAGHRYQVYKPDGSGDRILEFTVRDVAGGVVNMVRGAHIMAHVKGIPAGSRVMEELNFFRVRQSPGFTLQGVNMDGLDRGAIRGHTIYCGVYATGLYKKHERATTLGLTIRNCSFRNLKGRGIAFYGLADVVIEDNFFGHIRAQAIEIDHFSSGIIKNNHVDGAQIGVMVNDAYESIVEGNILQNCDHAVRFLEIYQDDWVNTGNIIRENWIGPGCKQGIVFHSDGMVDNLITGNHFTDLDESKRIIDGEGNRIE